MASTGTVKSYDSATSEATITVEDAGLISAIFGAFGAVLAVFSDGDLTSAGTKVYCGMSLGIAMLLAMFGGAWLGALFQEYLTWLPGVGI